MKKWLVVLLLLLTINLLAQPVPPKSFHVVPLGVKGGIDESNLSAYMVAPVGSNQYICLDAGTIHAGLEKAVALKAFSLAPTAVLRQMIKGYCISHAHLDHVAGLILSSPDDISKTVYALPACMKILQADYFNGAAWANFGDEGKGILLKKYHFNTLIVGQATTLSNTDMQVKAFALSHVKPYESTAFLVSTKADAAVLYLGDTGPDEIEKSNQLQNLWQAVAPLVQAGKLKGLMSLLF